MQKYLDMSKKSFYLCSSNKTNINLKFRIMIEIIKGSEFDLNFQIGSVYNVSLINLCSSETTLKIISLPRNEILYCDDFLLYGGRLASSLLVYYLIRLSKVGYMSKAPDKEKRLLRIFLLLIGINDFDFRD